MGLWGICTYYTLSGWSEDLGSDIVQSVLSARPKPRGLGSPLLVLTPASQLYLMHLTCLQSLPVALWVCIWGGLGRPAGPRVGMGVSEVLLSSPSSGLQWDVTQSLVTLCPQL